MKMFLRHQHVQRLALPLSHKIQHTRPHLRLFSTSLRKADQIAHANTVERPDLLRRNPRRPLPSLESLSSTRQWIRTLPIFLAVITISALGIFNYQKVNSPIITATMYSLRTNPTVRQELGDEVYFASKWAWIWGPINLVRGNVDVSFRVKGTRKAGWCRFRAKRFGGKGGAFKTLEWSLTLDDDGRVIQLLDLENRDPLEGTNV